MSSPLVSIFLSLSLSLSLSLLSSLSSLFSTQIRPNRKKPPELDRRGSKRLILEEAWPHKPPEKNAKSCSDCQMKTGSKLKIDEHDIF